MAPDALSALNDLAARAASQGHALQAIKCLEACLRLSSMPADEAQVRLRAARLLLQHTANLGEAKQHLQKAQLLVQKLPSHHLLKCEVQALLGRAHKYLGEVDYQRAAYEKGLEACKRGMSGAGAADSATRVQLQRWACYFHLRTADALVSQADSGGAAAAVARGVETAQKQGLVVEELVLRLFQMQLSLVAWDRPAVQTEIEAIGKALAAAGDGDSGRPQQDTPVVQQLKLQFNVLQIIYSIRLGHYDQLVRTSPDGSGGGTGGGSGGGADATPLAISTMEELLAAVRASGGAEGYEWLPLDAQEALVQLLASTVLRAPGKVKPAMAHVAKGLAAADSALDALSRELAAAASGSGGEGAAGSSSGGGGDGGAAWAGSTWGEQRLDHQQVWVARTLVVLRILLIESRMQLHLLQSNFAAARADAAANLALAERFPVLLAAMRPALHMQAALYAHAVGAYGAARAHYSAAAAASSDSLSAGQARALSALARLALGGPGAAGEGIEDLGEIFREGPDPEAGYGERVLGQLAGALLRLATPGDGPQQAARVAEAKVALGKALKTAHNRLHSHQLLTQLLNAMAPLRVDASDVSGAQQMLTSAFTLAKGMGDLNSQAATLTVLQQVYVSTNQSEQAAQNSNYLARKKAELGTRLAAAEADATEHTDVLTWGLA